ncbi:MAG TPA: FGGY-family carbohydrate kinase, partial [Limnochordia bacterium]|nr:FGGY-family carbohydrate kinase [Limnochordia bacterium]
PGGEWSMALAETFALPVDLMAPLIEPATELGPLLPEVAARVGAHLTVTAPTIHDTAAAVLATPAAGDDWCYLSSGTWSLLGIEVAAPILSPQALAANFTNESGIDGTFRFLKNVMGLWLLQECARAWGSNDFAGLVGGAVGIDPWQSIVDPDHADFLAPADMPAAIQVYCRRTGQPVPGEPAAIVRCIMDSLALKYALVLDQLEQTAHRNVRRIHVVGGGSQNHFLNQLTADATGCEVVAGPVEATAIGNALAQMIAGGQLTDRHAARELVDRSFELRRFSPRSAVPEAVRVRLRELTAQEDV